MAQLLHRNTFRRDKVRGSQIDWKKNKENEHLTVCSYATPMRPDCEIICEWRELGIILFAWQGDWRRRGICHLQYQTKITCCAIEWFFRVSLSTLKWQQRQIGSSYRIKLWQSRVHTHKRTHMTNVSQQYLNAFVIAEKENSLTTIRRCAYRM